MSLLLCCFVCVLMMFFDLALLWQIEVASGVGAVMSGDE